LNKRVRLADLSLIAVSILWGAGFIAVQYAIKSGLPVSLIIALRFMIGAITIFAFKTKKIFTMKKKEVITGVVAGAMLFLSFFTQTMGQSFSNVSNTAFITAIYVVLVPFIIWIVKGKPPKLKMFFLVFTTLIGVFVLTFKPNSSLLSLSLGDILLILCAVGFASHIAYLGIAARDLDPIKITFMQLLTSAFLGTIVFFSMDFVSIINLPNIDWGRGIISVLYLGIFSSALCYFLQTWAQTITTPSKAAIMMSAESLFGALFSILIGLEVFRINIPIGGVIILASVVLSEIELKRKERVLSEARLEPSEE